MIIAGIDYSMSSPAICIHEGKEWNHENCTFFYLGKKVKALVNTDQIKGSEYPEWTQDPERYHKLSTWALDILADYSVDQAFIEAYAFNAVGRVFQIAENTGSLKFQLWEQDIPYETYPPTMIKKFATNKGNAKKDMMVAAFIEETGIKLWDILGLTEGKHWNPISDLVDAYYIAKLGHQKLLTL